MNGAATERRIAIFVDRCTPEIAVPLREARQRLRTHFPRGVETPADLDAPAVAALILQAIAPHREALAAAAPLSTVIKAEVARQRPRRPATAKA